MHAQSVSEKSEKRSGVASMLARIVQENKRAKRSKSLYDALLLYSCDVRKQNAARTSSAARTRRASTPGACAMDIRTAATGATRPTAVSAPMSLSLSLFASPISLRHVKTSSRFIVGFNSFLLLLRVETSSFSPYIRLDCNRIDSPLWKPIE